MSMQQRQYEASWQWCRASDASVSDSVLIGHVQSIFRDGFDTERDWHETKIRQRLAEASVVGLFKIPDGPPAGYAIYSSPDETFDGKFVLWEDGICIRRSLQGQGVSPRTGQLLREFGSLLGREFSWLGGDTQNPVVYKRYARLGRVFPIDAPFTDGLGQRLLNFLLRNVPQVRNRSGALDVESGALKGIYREGRLGRYEIGISGAERFEEYLSQHQVDRELGDALLLVSELRSQE